MSKELEALEIECGELVEMDLLFLDRNGENQEKWHNSEAFKKAVEFEKKYGKSHTYILKSALLKAQEQEKEIAELKSRIQDLEKDLEEQQELAKHYLEEQEKENVELRVYNDKLLEENKKLSKMQLNSTYGVCKIKEKAFDEIQAIMDTWATSGLIADEVALEQIENVLKELINNDSR